MSCQPERAYFLGQVLAGFVERSFLLLVQRVYLAAHLMAVDALIKPRPALAKVMLGNVGHRQDVVAVAQLLADGGNVAVDATEVAHYHLFACTLRPLIAVGSIHATISSLRRSLRSSSLPSRASNSFNKSSYVSISFSF